MIKAVAIVVNPKSNNVDKVLQTVITQLKTYHVDVLLEKRASEVLGLSWSTPHEEIYEKADFIIVLGGDGTMLSAARLAGDSQTPILGVHMGNLGFITEISVHEVNLMVDHIMSGELPVNRRMRLECEVTNSQGQVIYKEHALNEVALIKGGIAKMIEFDVFVNDEVVNKYRADGFIVATPTGSTGYALSTGGPLVNPNMELIILTPICAHSLSSRNIIVGADSVVRIEIAEERGDIFVSQDGQVGRNLKAGEALTIKKTGFDTLLYYKPGVGFFSHLRQKFSWGAE